jgi:hypothetical protein
MKRIMDMYLRFAVAWYEDQFIEVFTTPTQHFQLAPAVNAVLAGNVGNSFSIWWRMQVFYLVLHLQKRWALCERIARPMCRPHGLTASSGKEEMAETSSFCAASGRDPMP